LEQKLKKANKGLYPNGAKPEHEKNKKLAMLEI